MTDANTHPTIVIGAGIVGAATAHDLQKRGERVILIEADSPGKGASFGNMASIAVNGFEAVSQPSTWKKIPFWLADPLAPIAADPRYLPKLVPWFLRFVWAGRPSKVREIEDAGAALALRTNDDFLAFLDTIGARDMWTEETCLSIYGSEKEFRDGAGNRHLMDRYGLPYEVLDGAGLRRLEPALNPEIRHGVLLPGNHIITDPYKLVLKTVDAFRAAGGRLETGRVTNVERADGAVSAVRLEDGRRIEAGKVLIAAGVRSRFLAADLGEPIPLETERGYHTQIMAPGITLKWSIIWYERAFMITPTAGGIRVGGSVEMAGLDKAPNYARARRLVEHARHALPGLKVEDASEWMGHRPALPDTIPVLSASAKTKGLYYATGHGHFGLTYAPTTARVMADLMTGRTPPIDLTPYRIDRY